MKDNLYYLSISVCIIASIILVIIKFYRIKYTLLDQKPVLKGPNGLPIVGYLPFLTSKPHQKLLQLSKKYGNVFK